MSCKDCINNDSCEKATHIENYRLKGCSDFIDAGDVRRAEYMFSKHELAKLYVKKLQEAEQPKICPWCGQMFNQGGGNDIQG